MRYRPDIDGMRSFAVMAVVLFHAGLSAVPGGFVGVDIFFVISGYLITRLIVHKLREGTFSFWDFYARRTRRIYPALFVLIPVVLLVGYFVLTPGEYEDLAWSAIYSAAFLANIYFWLNTGYFDLAAVTMPLLHLWSIGVEEQFYLMWPATLVLAWRLFFPLSRQVTLIALIVVTALLVLLCIVWTQYDAKAAFYLPFTRLWEFTLGALVLALPPIKRPRAADALSIAGLIAMIVAAVSFDESLAYPGHYALLPCLGVTAMIAAGERGLMNRLLSFPPNVLLGKLSYSLYLWHWPIFVYYAFYAGDAATPQAKLALVPVAIGLAYLSWRFVEIPARRRKEHPRRHVLYGLATATATACLAFIVVTNAGFPSRIPKEVRALGDLNSMLAFDCKENVAVVDPDTPSCVVGASWATASKHAVIWGESHAHHFLPLLDIVAVKENASIAYWPGCPPFINNKVLQRGRLNDPEYPEDCTESRRKFGEWIATNPSIDLVILADRWAGYPKLLFGNGVFEASQPEKAMKHIEDSLHEVVAEIDPTRRPILILGDVATPGFPVPNCSLQSLSGLWRAPCRKFREHFSNDERPTEKILVEIAAQSDRVSFLDTMKGMCAEPKGCPIWVGDEIIYRDTNHLRHDLSLATREMLVAKIGLQAALRAAFNQGPEAERAEFPPGREHLAR